MTATPTTKTYSPDESVRRYDEAQREAAERLQRDLKTLREWEGAKKASRR